MQTLAGACVSTMRHGTSLPQVLMGPEDAESGKGSKYPIYPGDVVGRWEPSAHTTITADFPAQRTFRGF